MTFKSPFQLKIFYDSKGKKMLFWLCCSFAKIQLIKLQTEHEISVWNIYFYLDLYIHRA